MADEAGNTGGDAGGSGDGGGAGSQVQDKNVDNGGNEGGSQILGGTEEKVVTAPADWPTNWRELATKGMDAADAAKEIKRLERFQAPGDIYKAFREAEKKLTSGEYRTAAPKDATPEQLSAWRKDNGIPEKYTEYDLKIDGVAIGDQDKPYVDKFLEHMHAKNASPEMVQTALKAYYDNVNAMTQQMEESDAEYRNQSEEMLRKEWGGDFKGNINRIEGMLDGYGQDVRNSMLGARLPNGRLLKDDPQMLQALAGMAREINPAAAVVPGAGQNVGAAIADELTSIKKMMGNGNSEYWKGPKAAGLQERYRELITAQQQITRRGV